MGTAPKPKRVAVAMSGGVDSSVAAGLLVQQGYEVFGLMMRLWSEADGGQAIIHNRCCTPDQMADARRVADRLDIPFYVLDVQDYFRATVVDFFIEQHGLGRTPNPCIECNRTIRFGYLLDQALNLGADYLATGHYAQVRRSAQGWELLKAVDADKDQSYVLHVLNQVQLERVLFPVGSFRKDEVRAMAAEMGLPVASKSESMDLCFLRDGDYRRFLAEHQPVDPAPGPIVDVRGRVLGMHEGLANYTIGQRKGLGVAAGERVFVVSKDEANNRLVVGARIDLATKRLYVRDVNWVAGRPPADGQVVDVKIRYRALPASGQLVAVSGNGAHVCLNEPVFGATPGQGAVFYEGPACVGGGIIAQEES